MKSAIVERIQKLLALAESSNEHEARAAAEQAARLLIKHNLKRQDITEKRDYETRHDIGEFSRVPPEYKFVQAIVRKFFYVEIISARRPGSGETKIHFVGESENVDVAAYVFEFLLREFRACWDVYRKKTGAIARARQAYYFGLHTGLTEQLSAASRAVESETGLVVVRDPGLRLALRDAFKVKTSPSRVPIADQGAVAAGHEHGRSMQIRKGITTTATGSTLMLGGGK